MQSQRVNQLINRKDLLSEKSFSGEDINVLLNELQIYQLELEMQNDELKASYTMLDQERAKFVALYDLAPLGYFILDYMGIVEDANQNGIDLLNTSKKSILGQRFQRFIPRQSWESFYNFLHRMQQTDGKQSAEMQLVLPDQKVIYIRLEGRAISNSIVTEIKYFIAIIDITISRNAQQVLKDTTERLDMTLKASATGTWTIGFGSNEVFFDDHSFKILGIDKHTFSGTVNGFLEHIDPEELPLVKHSLLLAVNGLKEVDLEFKVLTDQGQIKYIAAKGHQIQSFNNETYFAGILTDITERKYLEMESESLRNSQQKLILSATIAAQEKERDSISRALHDSVCQILYGIRLNLENLQRTKYMKSDFENINQLLNQAIRETRQLSYELTPSVLKDFGFVAGIKEMAQRTSTPRFRIDTFIDSSADTLTEDVQLSAFRMIQELISNCIKHARATRAEIRVILDNNEVAIVVTDNGKGLTTKTEEVYKIGSGLSGIKNRVYLLNGKMDLQSAQGGLTVSIRFKNE